MPKNKVFGQAEGGWYINERVFISMTGYEYNGTKIGRSEPYTYFMKS